MNDFRPTPKQMMTLWNLLVNPAGAFVGDLEPATSNGEAEILAQLGLVETESRRRDGSNRPALYATLSERGWAFVERNLEAEIAVAAHHLPRKAGYRLIQGLLKGLNQRIAGGGTSLAEFIGEGLPPPPRRKTSRAKPKASPRTKPAAAKPMPQIRERILEACRRLERDGAYNTRIRLAELRSQLPDVAKDEWDAALIAMEKTHVATLLPIDNTPEITAEDMAAAVANSAGRPRHLLYLQPRE